MNVHDANFALAIRQRDTAQGRLDAVRALCTTRPHDPQLAARILRALGPAQRHDLNRDWPGRAEVLRSFGGELDTEMVDQIDAAHTTGTGDDDPEDAA